MNDNIQGYIGINDDYEEMAASDKILLQAFGICYDENLDCAVAVYLRDLSKLSPEHQQIWKSKELKTGYKLHPDYYCNSILGEWGQRISIFDAFTEELRIINEMAIVMGHERLFRKDFCQSNRPVEFSFLIRPTLKEYNDFVLLLDKMISDNINKKFFRNEVAYEKEEIRDDGKVVVRNKGTLQILDEWIHKYYQTSDWEPIEDMIKVFKRIRKERQKPAHAIKENEFSQEYFHKQRELIIQAYEGVQTLRVILAKYPLAAEVEVHECLRDGKIWTF